MPDLDVEITYAAPTPTEYLALRQDGGLKVFSADPAARGLSCSLFCVALRSEGVLIGMGRVVGDGGCFCQVVDIVVLGRYRGRGLGKIILSEISKYITLHLPADTYVSLLADLPADRLYRLFGFVDTGPRTIGMALLDRKAT
jgi:GNAT superfamily N-acetyltransferase